jgi:hypothetical protein
MVDVRNFVMGQEIYSGVGEKTGSVPAGWARSAPAIMSRPYRTPSLGDFPTQGGTALGWYFAALQAAGTGEKPNGA